MEHQQKGPEKRFRAGAIAATVWKNKQQADGKSFSFHSVKLERNYKDKNGAWKTTNSFRATDLPKAALVLNKAYEYISLDTEGQQLKEAEVF